jgi:hypothetical protein
MLGFQLTGLEAQREAKYQALATMEADTRRAILTGQKHYPYRPPPETR